MGAIEIRLRFWWRYATQPEFRSQGRFTLGRLARSRQGRAVNAAFQQLLAQPSVGTWRAFRHACRTFDAACDQAVSALL